MLISDIAKQYVSTNTSSEAMTGTRGIEKLVSSIRDLTAGNIFEGTVNSIQNGKVVLGLSNGTLINARLDASMQLLQGQSMFFQVKSNNGETIAIRPYTVDGNGVNLTLLNALDAAGLPVTDKHLNLANNMMQEHMPIDKNTMNQMARILMANPDMSVNTLVQMKKLDLPITKEMVAQFENYVDDSSQVHKALDSFIKELPTTMARKDLPLEQLKVFDGQLLQIVAQGMEETEINLPQMQLLGDKPNVEVLPQEQTVVVMDVAPQDIMPQTQASARPQIREMATPQESVVSQGAAIPQEIVVSQEAAMSPEPTLQRPQENVVAQEPVILQEQIMTKANVTKLIKEIFPEAPISKEDSPVKVLNTLSNFILTSDNVTKEALSQLFSSKDMQQFIKEVLQSQVYLSPEDVADGEKIKKLYERLGSKARNLESLLNQTGLQDTPLAKTVSDVRGNVEFMNQLNQAYTYVQIPLKMRGQNASGQLYVYTNKRDIKDPEKELSAFLHLDLDHLGSTDVSVKMLHKKVDTKFYMDSDEAFELVKAHMEELEERLRLKGFDAKIYVENEGKKVNFLDDFLKKDAPPTGQLHRYSFDVRA